MGTIFKSNFTYSYDIAWKPGTECLHRHRTIETAARCGVERGVGGVSASDDGGQTLRSVTLEERHESNRRTGEFCSDACPVCRQENHDSGTHAFCYYDCPVWAKWEERRNAMWEEYMDGKRESPPIAAY